jgi:hypothetical protein
VHLEPQAWHFVCFVLPRLSSSANSIVFQNSGVCRRASLFGPLQLEPRDAYPDLKEFKVRLQRHESFIG